GPTHEEVITTLASLNLQSYRDLPVTLYQVQTKFRDEPRPRGGLIRVREFAMKDAYSFDRDWAGLDVSYQKMFDAYKRIYARCGLVCIPAEADSGAIGGKDSVEFILRAESGEDQVVTCPSCGYAANQEKAACALPPLAKEPELPIEEVATPGQKAIEEVAGFLKVPPSKTLKSLFYWAQYKDSGFLVMVVIRGDLEVNEVKLKNAICAVEVRLATDAEVQQHSGLGAVTGYLGPLGWDPKEKWASALNRFPIIVDRSVERGGNYVAGANIVGYHLRNVNYPRDFRHAAERPEIGERPVRQGPIDLIKVQAGYPCPACNTPLTMARGIEVGHVFKLGTRYSEQFNAHFLDQDGQRKPMVMGCYGLGIGRLLAAAVEQNHDEHGIVWPVPIAPFQVHLCALSADNPEIQRAAEIVYAALTQAGIDTLYDDRVESPGVKFNDADLLGIPVRLTVSPRTLKSQSVELKRRTEKEARHAPLEGAVAAVKEMLGATRPG
ncbi:MAG: proline--tRNA ligase, partial [Chloroflexi bacterium]|nr:proline--tRNA ligase [Chloroflexota bacterium]